MNTLADNHHFMACPKEKVDKPFGYENIFSIFILFAIVVAFSVAVVLGEVIISAWKKLKKLERKLTLTFTILIYYLCLFSFLRAQHVLSYHLI